MIYSKGISWIDDCRIPFVDEESIDFDREQRQNHKLESDWGLHKKHINKPQGRFTPNLLVCDDMLNDGTIGKGQKNPRIQKTDKRYGENNFTHGGLFTPEGNITPTYNDKGSNSRFYDIDLWFSEMIKKIT